MGSWKEGREVEGKMEGWTVWMEGVRMEGGKVRGENGRKGWKGSLGT